MSSSLPSLPRVPAVPTADMVKLHEQRLDRRRGHSLMLTGGAPLHPETDWKLRLLQKNLHSNHKLIHTLPLSPENAFYLESRKRRSEAKAAEEEAARKAASEASAAKQAPTSTSGRLKKKSKACSRRPPGFQKSSYHCDFELATAHRNRRRRCKKSS